MYPTARRENDENRPQTKASAVTIDKINVAEEDNEHQRRIVIIDDKEPFQAKPEV
jgi:hypothetical protein